MLLRFGASNIRSIYEYQEVSFMASSLKDAAMEPINIPRSKKKALPVIGVYGANASGKSNLLVALKFAVSGILNSYGSDPSGNIKRPFFKLADNGESLPTKFDCDFLVDGLTFGHKKLDKVRMHYGFSISSERILEEWLYAFPSNVRQVWFHRKAGGKPEFYFGKALKGRNRTIEEFTKPISLFLSTAAQSNHEQLTIVRNYFAQKFDFLLSMRSELRPDELDKYLGDKTLNTQIVEFLKHADIGVCAARIKKTPMPEKAKPMMEDLAKLMSTYGEKIPMDKLMERRTIELAHRSKKGEVFFDSKDESRGTLALLNMLGPMLVALARGSVVIVDELDSSMHPLLAQTVLRLFAGQKTNPNGAQLLFTTHDTNLLSQEVLRRDQIWFVEKNSIGASHIFPLSSIAVRNTDNIQRGYLQGRFGAIPFLGDLANCFNRPETKKNGKKTPR